MECTSAVCNVSVLNAREEKEVKMGREQVYKRLTDKWQPINEIEKGLDIARASIMTTLRKMRRISDDVDSRKLPTGGKGKKMVWHYRRI